LLVLLIGLPLGILASIFRDRWSTISRGSSR
jgi:ABC-type antimicrobial peptide transport system permease subunit